MSTTPDREIVSSRILNAPRDLVFKAHTDPAHLKTWWGPAGFTNTFHEYDPRPGGRWIFTMHGPDKGDYANECEFIEIEPPARLAWKRHSQPLFQMLITLEELPDNKTNHVWKMLFDSAAECAKFRAFAPEKNEENLDRLEAELLKMAKSP